MNALDICLVVIVSLAAIALDLRREARTLRKQLRETRWYLARANEHFDQLLHHTKRFARKAYPEDPNLFPEDDHDGR